MRLGIFGGTFDPPHIAHLILAAEALSQLKIDRILWVLTPEPPHKLGQKITPLDIRLQLLKSALGDDPAFELSSVDIDRSPPHYAVDTMHLLAEQYPGAELVYLMGGDSLHDLPNWHEPQQFIRSCKFLGVMHRPGDLARLDEVETKLPGISTKVRWIVLPLLQVSSTDIRQRIAEGRPYRYFLPASVYELIKSNGLYLAAQQ
jgi:nicotinate-nucleotide adenylyltransferase